MSLITKKQIYSAGKTFLFGGIIGSSMLIPGVSGGTMAIILGIYDRLVNSVGNIFKETKRALIFLGITAAGGMLGLIFFSSVMLDIVKKYPVFSMYFFIGAILGSIPMLVKKSGISEGKWYNVFFALLGIVGLFLLRQLPEGNNIQSSPFMLFICGIIIAAAMVLPGISTSHILLILGMYEIVWGGLKNAAPDFWIFLGSGAAIGTFLTAKLADKAMKKYPCQTYMIIIGFVMTSVYDIFPSDFIAEQIPFYLILAGSGFLGVSMLSKYGTN